MKLPFADHLRRTWGRYQADHGDRLAAAVTFYWFLSLFPILLIAIFLFRLLNGDSAVADVRSGLSGYLPAQLVDTVATTLEAHAGKAGVIGLLGLLISGLGWIDALREAIREVWHITGTKRNLVVRKLIDVAALVGLFATIGASVFLTGLAGSGPRFLLSQLGVDKTSAAILFTKVLGFVLAGLADVVLFLYLFLRLAHVRAPVRQVLPGAVFGAFGFFVLKLIGGYYVQHTTSRGEATYGTFAVVAGLLLFLNLISRLVLVSAAFAVTGSPGHGRLAPDEGGSMEQSWAPRTKAQQEGPPVAVPIAGSQKVELAARATAAVVGMALAAVAVYALRALQGLLRR